MAKSVHPTAIVEAGAHLGEHVTVGEYSIIRSGVTIGKHSSIGAFCELGGSNSRDLEPKPLIFGANTMIRSHSTFYGGSLFGDNLSTGHKVTVRSGTVAGESLQLGTGTDVQGDCVIQNFVRMHSNVHVSMKSVIENYAWLFPGVVLTNDPRPPSENLLGVRVEEFAVLAAGVIVLPGKTVGRGSLIAAGSVLTRNAEGGCLYFGNPAKSGGSLSKLKIWGENESLYPWRYRFHRGYPSEVVKAWLSEISDE